MNFPTPARVDLQVSTLVTNYLKAGESANLTDLALADLAGITKVTLYRWRSATPDRRLTVMNFMSLVAAHKALDQGFEAGELPVKNRKGSRRFVNKARSVTPASPSK